jgi:glycosyltransferase involved in cell wall biosynthesis
MRRKKILWLASWYPNKTDPFDGDFVQRHARAAAIYHDIHILFATTANLKTSAEVEIKQATGLTEQFIYFTEPKGIFKWLRKQVTYRKLFLDAIKQYIDSNGLPDLLHVHVPWKAGLIALQVQRKFGIKFIVTEHWGIYNRIVADNWFTQSFYVREGIASVIRRAQTLVSVSSFLGERINEFVVPKAYTVIPNVVDTSLFYLKQEKYSKFTFIHVSNMVPLKNVDVILKAFYKLRQQVTLDVQLILVGNRNNEYVQLAHDLELLNSCVFFKGEIAYQEVANEMQRCHSLLMCSSIENAPCVIAEALCCGLPIVSTNVGGTPELVDDTNGILLPDIEESTFAYAMQDMVESYEKYNPELISSKAARKFRYSTVAEQFRTLYGA